MYIFFGIFILICIFLRSFFTGAENGLSKKFRNMSPCAQKKAAWRTDAAVWISLLTHSRILSHPILIRGSAPLAIHAFLTTLHHILKWYLTANRFILTMITEHGWLNSGKVSTVSAAAPKSASTVPIQFYHRTGLPMPALKAFPIPWCCRCPCSFFIKADHCFASDRPTGGWRASVRDFFAYPQDLSLRISITFLDREMADSFTDALIAKGYCPYDIELCSASVAFTFGIPHSFQPRCKRPFVTCMAQRVNRIYCRIFNKITRPFADCYEQILYLYFYLPFAFRRLLRMKRHKTQKFHRCRRWPVCECQFTYYKCLWKRFLPALKSFIKICTV